MSLLHVQVTPRTRNGGNPQTLTRRLSNLTLVVFVRLGSIQQSFASRILLFLSARNLIQNSANSVKSFMESIHHSQSISVSLPCTGQMIRLRRTHHRDTG